MIGYLQGSIISISSDQILLLVSGVGYQVFLPSRNLTHLSIAEEASFFIHTQTKEDGISLFGFTNLSDKEIFLALIKVGGIGGRTAMGILGIMDANSIMDAISFEDKASFQKISGIGPKAAERIIYELKDKIGKVMAKKEPEARAHKEHPLFYDALSALENLGYQKIQIIPILKDLMKDNHDLKSLITKSLQLISKS